MSSYRQAVVLGLMARADMREFHLLNPMENAYGGSERRTLALADLLGPHSEVKIWCLKRPDPNLRSRWPMAAADISKLRFPKGGTLVVVGCYFELPTWLSVMRPERTIVVFNIPYVQQLAHTLYVLNAFGIGRIEVVAANQVLAKVARELGADVLGVEPSWIDLKAFAPAKCARNGPFTVGRHSRDVADKFHSEDPRLFQTLSKSGVALKIMGGQVLRPLLNGDDSIELLPVGSKRPEAFLQGLDAFLYRTSEAWQEAWGRVVAEAMASGLPTVLDSRVGFVEALSPGEDALVFESTEDAIDQIQALRSDAELRAKLGARARATVERILGPEARRKWIDAYIRGTVAAP